MIKILLTTDILPAGLEIKSVFPIIQLTVPIKISNESFFTNFLTEKRNEYQDAINAFINMAPDESDAIVGVQISTSTASFSDGVFLFITYIGTPVTCNNWWN